jgi:transposase
MRRSNQFDVRPRTGRDAEILHRVLDASASLWNEVNYERRQQFFEDESVWNADTGAIEGQYKGILGAATTQQVIRRNSEAWRSFFACLEDPDEDAKSTRVLG